MTGGEGQDDRTVVVSAGDETVVVPQRPAEDETIVAPRGDAGDETVVGDATIAVPLRPAPDETVVVAGEGTVVVPQMRTRAEVRAEASAGAAAAAQRTTGVLEESHGAGESASRAGALDPRRQIAPVPGTTPWEVAPVGQRGVAQGMPVSYGARRADAPQLQIGLDEVHRRVGPAPEARPVAVRPGREQLPSLARRARRRRVITLVSYGIVLVLSAVGLWALAILAFG